MSSARPSSRRRFPALPRFRAAVLGRAAAATAVFALLLAGAASLGIAAVRLPAPLATRRLVLPAGTLTLLDNHGDPLAELAGPTARRQRPVPLDAVSPELVRVTVALEDRRFFRHRGVDGRALLAAAARNLTHGRVVSGASTLTEQLVKLAAAAEAEAEAEARAGAATAAAAPAPDRARGTARPARRDWTAKLREAAAACRLEGRWRKEEILCAYLNAVSYGNRLVGPEAAAQAYFHKSARELDLAEAVYLAGLPQAPTRLNPWRHPAAAEYRYQRNVRRLAARGELGADDARRLAEAPPRPEAFRPAVRRAPHFVDYLRARDPALAGIVRTTLDPGLQRATEELLRAHQEGLRRLGADAVQAAAVIVENDGGAVRAFVGSADYGARAGQVDGVVRGRSAGSTLKPFVYLAALDRRRLTAATLLPDTAEAIRSSYPDYDPQDYSGRHLGPVRVRQALGSSLNVPAVVVLGRYVGARRAFYELRRWGFGFPGPLGRYGAGFILGNADVRLLDLAGAYAGLARGGVAQPPRLLAGETAPQQRLASPEATAIITDVLCDPAARRATFGAGSPLDFPDGVRVAVKTGTSSGFRDKWCVGFTGRHTVAVWAGRFDGRPMEEAVAIHAAAPLWHALVERLLRVEGDPPVPPPAAAPGAGRLVRCAVCPLTGLRPAPAAGGPEGVDEWFLPGTEPASDAGAAGWFRRDGPGGAPRLHLPAEYAAWCQSPQNLLGAVADPAPTLTILSPRDGSAYRLDDDLPAGQQNLELVSDAADPRRVRWSVNGAPLASDPGGRAFWPLAPGRWEVVATLAPDGGTGPPPAARSVVQVDAAP